MWLIDAIKVEQDIISIPVVSRKMRAGIRKALRCIEEAPRIDAVPVIHAHWILHRDGSGTCSNCHRTQKDVWDMDTCQNFCGHCGAEMDLEDSDG